MGQQTTHRRDADGRREPEHSIPRPDTVPGPGTRGHDRAARLQVLANDPAIGLHPLVVVALVAAIGLAVLAWDPLGAPAVVPVAGGPDIGTAHNEVEELWVEKAAITSRATVASTPVSDVVEAAVLKAEKAALTASASATSRVATNAASNGALRAEKVAMAARAATAAGAPSNASADADLAGEKAARLDITPRRLLTAEDEKRLLVARRS